MTSRMVEPRAVSRIAAVAACTALLGAAGCWRSSPPPAAPLSVTRVSPHDLGEADAAPLLLNDNVTVYFSDAIDPLSVTAASVAVFDAAGHAVPGTLRTGTNWVTFAPEPPLSPALDDGSFLPGESYRLVVASYPRPDAVRAVDGRRLAAAPTLGFRTAEFGPVQTANGRLPAPLRPPSTELPFLQHRQLPGDIASRLPADAPRLRLHFTLPVLPTTVRPEAFIVHLAQPQQRLEVRRARLLTAPLDQHPGSTVELDLGSEPRLHGGGPRVELDPGELLSVTLADGPHSLRDLADQEVFGGPVGQAQFWLVVAGSSLPLFAWPTDDGGLVGDDELQPGFEARAGLVRPRVRIEAGDGSLGVFRPQADITLRPGVPFDRGDGVLVQSVGADFPFLAIDIPAGVRVRVESSVPVQLLACGGIRVAGTLELSTPTELVPRLQRGAPASEVLAQAPAALVAAGDIWLSGTVTTARPLPTDQTALTVASAARIELGGEMPYNTVLAVERGVARGSTPIVGPRGQSFPTTVEFEYGLAPGARIRAQARSEWRELGRDRDRGVLRFVDVDPALRVEWQTAPADPVQPDRADLRSDRLARPRRATDGEWLALEPGSFGRFLVSADLVAGLPLPSFEELRLADR